MGHGFKDRIAPKKEEPKNCTKSPWNFKAPSYDERHSCFVNAGQKHGTGFNQPVGSEKASKEDAMPMSPKTIIVKTEM